MHGLSKTRLYAIFSGMKQRCYNEKNQHYKWYGAKGIIICPEWLGENGLSNFIEWSLNNGYEEHLTIDRIDSNGPYSPDNCRWITGSQNATFAHGSTLEGGNDMTIEQKIKMAEVYARISETELAKRLGTSPQALNQRMKTGKFSSTELERIAEALGAKFSCSFTFPDGTVI